MKNLLYILATIIFISSCKSIDKMVESGNYDEAIRYAVDHLRGKKNKKTKYVKALEKAYAKLNAQDLKRVEDLQPNNDLTSHNKIIDIFENITARQDYIRPLLPLVSKKEYRAKFKMLNYSNAIAQEKEELYQLKLELTEESYQEGILKLKKAVKQDNKRLAKLAFNSFTYTEKYFGEYKDTDSLLQRAYELGQTRVLIEPYAAGSNISFDHTLSIISLINIGNLNKKWTKFYTTEGDKNIDYIATIEIAEIIPGKERERFNSFTETREVVDGKIPVKDTNGNTVTDTSGNIIYTERKISVTAYIEEMEREKIAQMNGKIVIVNNLNNTHINTIPIGVQHIFEDYSCNFRGDKRALPNGTNKRLRSNCAPFPTDYEMTTDLAYEYKKVAEAQLKKMNFI